MKRFSFLLLASLALSGCAMLQGLFTKPSEVVSFPRGAFALTYADMGRAYAVMSAKIQAGCLSGKFDRAFCANAAKIDDRVQLLDGQIRQVIMNPTREVDWEAIGQAIGLIVKLAALVP